MNYPNCENCRHLRAAKGCPIGSSDREQARSVLRQIGLRGYCSHYSGWDDESMTALKPDKAVRNG